MTHCSTRQIVAGCFLLLLIPQAASATPANRQALLRYLGPFQSEQVESCAVCHVRARPEGAESLDEFPHNAFGDRLRVLGEEKSDAAEELPLRDRLARIADEDADGDGVPNLRELLAGTLPGSSDDKPAPVESERIRKLLVDFAEFSSR